MDMTQLAQAVNWLQEERRRDRIEIDKLTQRLESMKNESVEQGSKGKDLEGRFASLSAQLARVLQMDASMDKVKKEVTLLMEKHEKQIQQAEKDAIVLRQMERESAAKSIEDIRAQLERVGKSERDTLHSITLLEELSRRNERNIQQLQTLDAELRHQQTINNEALHLAEVERQRHITQWQTELQSQRKAVEQHTTQISSLQEQTKDSRQLFTSLSIFEDRVNRQQEQVAELQRLAEDRQKRELAEWQTENEKRWKRQEAINEQQMGGQQAQGQQLTERIEAIEERLVGLSIQIEVLWKTQRAFAYHQVTEVQNWLTDFEKLQEEYEPPEASAPLSSSTSVGATARSQRPPDRGVADPNLALKRRG